MKKLVEPPSLMRLLCGSALAYWLSGLINPAFVIIAVLIAFFIPIFLTDYSYLDADDPAKSPDNSASASGHTQASNKQSNPANRVSSTSRLLREKEEADAQHAEKQEKDDKKPNPSKAPKKH